MSGEIAQQQTALGSVFRGLSLVPSSQPFVIPVSEVCHLFFGGGSVVTAYTELIHPLTESMHIN